MKELLSIVLITLAILSIAGFVAAQSNATVSLPAAGMLPDNPFYGFGKFFEQLQLFLTFNSEGKAQLHLQFAEKRLAELNESIAEGKNQNIPSLETDYENELDDAQSEVNATQALGRNATALAEHVAEETFKHTLVLEDLLDKVPEQARVHIENALNKSEEGHDEAVGSIFESRNVTGTVTLAFTIDGQTFTQTFNVTMEHGRSKVERHGEETQTETETETESQTQTQTTNAASSSNYCSQDSDCICDFAHCFLGNKDYWGKNIRGTDVKTCPDFCGFVASGNRVIKPVCENGKCVMKIG